jgi:polysaccharide pyruvyl transferase WcaK-like protein
MSVLHVQCDDRKPRLTEATSNLGGRIRRIVVENGMHSLTNMGDVAMLQVLVSRVRKLWPDASVEVITDAPDLLSVYCPSVKPVPAGGRRTWFKHKGIFGHHVHQVLPAPASSRAAEFEREIRCRWPSLARTMIQSRMKLRRVDDGKLDMYLDAFFAADLVLLSGGADINDSFRNFAMTLLDGMAMAFRRGIQTAILGQGFGPIRDPNLFARAKVVLPSVGIICCRESRAGVPLLYSLGVSPNRVITTGDDAIELAYEARAKKLGTGIGVNLRVVDYSQVSSNIIEKIRPVIHHSARKHSAPLVPIPIALNNRESDPRAIRQILEGYDDASDGGQDLKSPLEVIRRIGGCRVVVTGSYHAGVFALSQGVPVVGLAKSAYYVDKFLGLADQFGSGCQVIFLDDEQLCGKLTNAIDIAWRSADHVRLQLLESARKQMALGHDAYQRLYELVTVTKPTGFIDETTSTRDSSPVSRNVEGFSDNIG